MTYFKSQRHTAVTPMACASFDHAVQQHQAGELATAEQAYLAILDSDPQHAGALHMLGVVELQRKNFRGALDFIARALRFDSGKAVYFNNYGAALHGLGCYVEALACFHRATALQPKYADAISNVAMAYESMGQLEKAAAHYREALSVQPEYREARSKLILLLEKTGKSAEAIELFRASVDEEPTAQAHVRLGNLLLSTGDSVAAVQQYESAILLDPENGPALYNLGNAYQEQHRVSQAREVFRRAAASRPRQPLWKLRAAAACPAVFGSSQEIDDFCEQLSRELDQWLDQVPNASWQDLVNASAFPNFSYSYLGRNVRSLKEKFANIYRKCFESQPEALGSGLTDRRRLGIVVTPRHEGVFLRCMREILQGLSRDRLELVLICGTLSKKSLMDGLGIEKLKVIEISTNLESSAKAVRDARCDMLYFWESGSDAVNYFLPFCRLAPIQSTSHGSQLTTGNAAIDFFLASSWMEASDSSDHYSEQLWQAETLLITHPRLAPPPSIDRGKLGLPDGRTLYMCLQNPLKLHPDFDELMGGVLRGDHSGLVVLLRGPHPYAEQQLRQRFALTLGDVQDRIIFLPQQPFSVYCRLLQLADVVLDPPHFGHASSAYDVFSYNRPLVTMPSRLYLGRIGTAFYRRMGLTDLVVESADAYISFALRLGRDADYRRHIESRIAESSEILFNDHRAVQEHERFFAEASQHEG